MHNIENISDINKIDRLNSDIVRKLKFKEIQCPLSRNILVVKNCNSCKYCQKIEGSHQSKRTLTALVCLYGLDQEDENK